MLTTTPIHHHLSARELEHLLGDLTARVNAITDIPLLPKVYGVPRGGVPVALALAGRLGLGLADAPDQAHFIVDDLVDSGATRTRYLEQYPNARFFALIDKQASPHWANTWVVFPWERTDAHDDSATDIVRRLLQYIGEDPTREGLRETPQRVLKAWREWASGYAVDIPSLFRVFEDGAQGCNELVVVSNIPVVSKCEHHLADITGVAHVGYIPNGRIIGLSKINRLVDAYARRLQVQERLTGQVADALEEHLAPKAVGVIVRAAHACMSSRGIKHHGSVTTTSAMRGLLLSEAAARAEFMAICRDAEHTRGGAL